MSRTVPSFAEEGLKRFLHRMDRRVTDLERVGQWTYDEELEANAGAGSSQETTVLDWNAAGWKYTTVAYDGMAGFQSTGYDDSSWSTGQGGFGDNGNDAVIGAGVNTIWDGDDDLLLRKTVTVVAGETHRLYCRVDDWADAYVDGTLLGRFTLSGDYTVTPYPEYMDFTPVDSSVVLAFRCRNRNDTSYGAGTPQFADFKIAELADGGGGTTTTAEPLDTFASVGDGDSFDGSTLDPAWSSLQATALATATVDGGFLLLANPSSTSDEDRGIQKAFVPAGDFEVQAKFSHMSIYKQYMWAGLFVGAADPANTTGSRLMCRLLWYGGRHIHFLRHSTGTWSDVFTPTPDFPGITSDGPIWQRIRRVGATVSVGHSIDGRVWVDHPTTTTIPFTVGTLGVLLGGNYAGNHPMNVLVDWVRTV